MEENKIKELLKYIPRFRNQIVKISTKDIEPNPENPRKKYGQEEEDELIESISSKGVLQPIIVFKDKNKFVLLDGQRRTIACKKLNLNEIPDHILDKKPIPVENISIMLHIHNVHEEWTDMAVVNSLNKLILEMKIKVRILNDKIKFYTKEFSKVNRGKDIQLTKYEKDILSSI